MSLQLGSVGPEVAQARQLLEAAGYSVPGDPQVFGPVMQAAVRSFQQSAGLQVDGVVGQNTLSALMQASQRQLPETAFEPEIFDAPPAPNSMVPIIAGLLIAAATWYFSKKEQKEATGDWEDEEAPKIRRQTHRITKEQRKLKKRKSEPLEDEEMEIDHLPEEDRGDLLVHVNAKLYKTTRNYREKTQDNARAQAEKTGRFVKVVDVTNPHKVLFTAESENDDE